MSDSGYAFAPPSLVRDLPPEVLAEVERKATERAELGLDANQVGDPEGRPGGRRSLALDDRPGFFLSPGEENHPKSPASEIVIVQVTAL